MMLHKSTIRLPLVNTSLQSVGYYLCYLQTQTDAFFKADVILNELVFVQHVSNILFSLHLGHLCAATRLQCLFPNCINLNLHPDVSIGVKHTDVTQGNVPQQKFTMF